MPSKKTPYADKGRQTASSIRSTLCQKTTDGDISGAEVDQWRPTTEDQQTMLAAARVVHDSATQVAAYGKVNKETAEGMSSVLEKMETACTALGSITRAYYSFGGKTLRAVTGAAQAELGEACAALVEAVTGVQGTPVSALPEDKLAQLAGAVWEKSDAFKKLPKDNRAAIGRALVRLAATAKDTIREMDEIKTDVIPESKPKEGQDDDDDDDDDADEDDWDDPQFDVDFEPEDLLIVKAAKPVFQSVLGAMKAAVRELSAAGEPGSAEEVGRVEEGRAAAARAVRAAEDLGAALYPEQEAAELRAETARLDGAAAELSGSLQAQGGGLLEKETEEVHKACVELQAALALRWAE